MDLSSETERLAGFHDRRAGSDSERRAACHVRDRLRELGREAELEPFRVRPHWASAQAVAAAVAVVGSVVSVSSPGLGLLLVAFAAVTSVVEATGAAHLLLRLTGDRTSQNVSSPGGRERQGVLLLVADCDVPIESAFARVARRVRDPWAVIGGAMLLILACSLLRGLGFEGNGLTAVQLVPTLILLAAVPLLVDVELSGAGGGGPQAAGTAVVLSLAAELESELRYLDVWAVVTGGRAPFGQGMRAWLRRHRGELDPKRTVVVTVEAVGSGGVRYARRAGPLLLSWKTSGDLVRICRDIAEDDEDGSAFDAQAVVDREPGDAVAASSRGLAAIGISTDDRDEVDPQAVERVRAFCAELARRIDVELAPRLEQEPVRPA